MGSPRPGMLRVLKGFLALTVALFASVAAGQYPSRPVRLLVPIPPGGGPDLVGRLIAARLSETLGQPVVVENRVGGNGVVAGEAVAKAAPDGYTLLVGMDSLVAINPHLYERMPFDPLSDLVPVASLVSNGFFLVVNPQLPVHDLAEFIEYAKRANPPLHYASGGNGSQHHLTMERLKSEEHTSELQSRSDLVCRLLLEKKNNNGSALHFLLPSASRSARQSASLGR